MTTAVVNQSNYIPWKGYFDLIHDADVFVFYDDVQYTKNDWRNRNKVKTAQGAVWLTIPTGTDASRLICEVRMPDTGWAVKHWKTIKQNYSRAPYFRRYQEFFEHCYLERRWSFLSELNQWLITSISREFLGITAKIRDSREFSVTGSKLDRLLDLVKKAGASRYVSGPSARDYIAPKAFSDAAVELVYKCYEGYPEYPQLYPPFDHGVSILDLLFSVGPDAPYYIWGWRSIAGGSRVPIHRDSAPLGDE